MMNINLVDDERKEIIADSILLLPQLCVAGELNLMLTIIIILLIMKHSVMIAERWVCSCIDLCGYSKRLKRKGSMNLDLYFWQGYIHCYVLTRSLGIFVFDMII